MGEFKMNEFNLSEKIEKVEFTPKQLGNCEMILKEDVKEFIRLFKEENERVFNTPMNFPNNRARATFYRNKFNRIIDNLAGDKLNGSI